MSRGLSLWLDALRVAATLLVVLSHVAYPRFTRGDYHWIRDFNLGSDAVIVFFVISGVVIAYAAERDGALSLYAFNRVSRLLSVLLPAIVLTFVFDRIGFAIDPMAYPAQFFQMLPLWEMLVRGISFSNEWALIDRVRLGTNGPLWSLSYEAAYYGLFGVAIFLRGPLRLALLLALALLVGPRILLLMPAWILGVVVWRAIAAGRAQTNGRASALLLAVGAPVIYVICLATDIPGALAAFTAEAFEPLPYRAILVFSDQFLWNGLIGVLAALHVFAMAHLLSDPSRGYLSIRWLAGASFSVYVTHYPTLHLLHASLPESMPGRDAALLVGSLAIGLLFAEIFERRIGAIRAACRRWLAAQSRLRSVP